MEGETKPVAPRDAGLSRLIWVQGYAKWLVNGPTWSCHGGRVGLDRARNRRCRTGRLCHRKWRAPSGTNDLGASAMARKTRRARKTWRAVTAALAILIGLTAAGASPASADPGGPVAPDLDQHCAVQNSGSSPMTIAIPTDRITLNLESVGYAPANSTITAFYTISGSTRTGTATGAFDTARKNATFNFSVSNPPAGATLTVTYQIWWHDLGVYYSNFVSAPLAPCTRDNTTYVDASTWDDHVTVTGVSQRCETVDIGVGGRHAYVREDIVTVNVAHGSSSWPSWYAGRPVWADYWIVGQKTYTPGASGVFDSDGKATLSFVIIAPTTGAELDVLASGQAGSRTFPAHSWATIAC